MSYETVEVPDEVTKSSRLLTDRNSQENENSMTESIIVDSAHEVLESVDLIQDNISNSIIEVPDLPNPNCLAVARTEPLGNSSLTNQDSLNMDLAEIERFGRETYDQLTKCIELTTAAEEMTSELRTKFANDKSATYENVCTKYWFDYFLRCKPQKTHLLAIEFITTNKNSVTNL